jgi:hypothetical protein
MEKIYSNKNNINLLNHESILSGIHSLLMREKLRNLLEINKKRKRKTH